jgi:hypothetical protein
VSDPKQLDRVFGNSWDMIPRATKKYIEDTFANDPGFMIRNDMIDNSIGYRMPSVKDAWTGTTRMSPVMQKIIKDSATILFGNKAVPWLVTAEKAWQAGIATAKHIIVVKSVIVPLSNEASNTTQLMSRGVPIRAIFKGKTGKLVEITQYLKNRDRAIEIDAQLARHRGDTLMTSKLTAQKKNLDDSNRSMSIWPLIKAGEFSTISDGQTEVDAALQTGKWVEYIQNLVDRIPSKLGTVGRYAMVTKDTALFQGMSRAVAYSDFLAKAILYDHLTKTKKIDATEALEKVSKEFVNYNFVAGRTRSYAESMGITWFWAYKLRSVGVALSTMRENPLRALLTTFGAQYAPDLPGVSVGSPVTDNAVSVVAGGRSSYSLGLDMLWTAPRLNPWVNAMHNF